MTISAVRKQIIHAKSARFVVAFPSPWVVTVCVICRCRGVNLVPIHADLLQIKKRVLLQVTVMVVEVDIIVHGVAHVKNQTGTPGVLIHVARSMSPHGPLERAAGGRRAVRLGLLRGGRGDGASLLGQRFPLARVDGTGCGEGVAERNAQR